MTTHSSPDVTRTAEEAFFANLEIEMAQTAQAERTGRVVARVMEIMPAPEHQSAELIKHSGYLCVARAALPPQPQHRP